VSRTAVGWLLVVVLSVLAALPGVWAGFVGSTLVDERLREATRPEDTVMVIVAARELDAGATIAEEDLYAVQIPPRYLFGEVFLSPEAVVGRTVKQRVLANEIVQAPRIE